MGLEEKKRLEIQNKIMTLRDKFEKECSAKNQKEYNERQKIAREWFGTTVGYL